MGSWKTLTASSGADTDLGSYTEHWIWTQHHNDYVFAVYLGFPFPLYPEGILRAFTIEGHVIAVQTHRQKWISRFSGDELLAGPHRDGDQRESDERMAGNEG